MDPAIDVVGTEAEHDVDQAITLHVNAGCHLLQLHELKLILSKFEELVDIGSPRCSGQPEHEVTEGFQRVRIAALDREPSSPPFGSNLLQAGATAIEPRQGES